MHILLSNDDGYLAPGLNTLRRALEQEARVTVVAPDRDRSGVSNALTLRSPLRAEEREPGLWVVDGTPTDCVHLALTGLLDSEPDVVVSGINAGANLGDDVLYSGTVAAAIEGRHLGYPALAVSLAGERLQHYESAVGIVLALLRAVASHPMRQASVLNVNVPDRPVEMLCGVRATRLGYRHRAEAVIRDTDPRGADIYWIGPAGPAQDAGPGTDFHAIEHGYVSVTPLDVDLTNHPVLERMSAWMDDLDVRG